MIINEKTEIHGEKVALVPYDEIHVPKYHDWMQSEELLQATESERLTLSEEYDMQKSWRQDDNKLTFIVLDKSKLEAGEGEVSAMIGDTNLFFDDERTAEVMIMIAEPAYRRQGFGREALFLLLRYGIEALDVNKYEAKITSDNTSSIKLFEKAGFRLEKSIPVFNETLMVKDVSQLKKEWLLENVRWEIKKRTKRYDGEDLNTCK